MSQVDDQVVSTSNTDGGDDSNNPSCCVSAIIANPSPSNNPSDLPPESFLLSKEAELDWIDQNAFLDRKGSTKGAHAVSVYSLSLYNLNSIQTSNNPNSNNPSSQRYSSSSKSSMATTVIGLPKSQKTALAEATNRRGRSSAVRLFPKRSANPSISSSSAGVGKSAVPMAEPSSPKVSCIGRVRSRRDRNRRKLKNRPKSSSDQSMKRSRSSKLGFWTSFRSIFHQRGRKAEMTRSWSRNLIRKQELGKSDEAPPPSLGAVKRFSSGRKSVDSTPEVIISSLPPDGDDVTETETAASIPIPSLGAVKMYSSGRRSDAWADHLEVTTTEATAPVSSLEVLPDGGTSTATAGPIPGLSSDSVKKFPSGRKSDTWADDSTVAPIPGLGAVKKLSSGRKSDSWVGDLESSMANGFGFGLGTMKRFSSGRRSDAWAADLVVIDERGTEEEAPPSLGALNRFSSGRRSDAWAGDLHLEAAKSEPSISSIWETRRRTKTTTSTKASPPRNVDVDRRWEAGLVPVGPETV